MFTQHVPRPDGAAVAGARVSSISTADGIPVGGRIAVDFFSLFLNRTLFSVERFEFHIKMQRQAQRELMWPVRVHPHLPCLPMISLPHQNPSFR